MVTVDIFQYDNFTPFLVMYCNQLKEADPKFSINWLSRRADIKSATLLRMILQRKRRPTLKVVEKLCRALQLEGKEFEYAVLIAEKELNRSPHIVRIVDERISSLRETDSTMPEYEMASNQ